MKAVLIGIAIFLGAILLLIGGILAWGGIYQDVYQYDAPEQIQITPNQYGTITAHGKALYDENGNRFDIKGVNFGNLFIAEGWMTINSIGVSLNDDGSFKKVNEEGIVEEYEEIYQEEMDSLLYNDRKFTLEQIATLNDAYFNSYCTEADFEFIQSIGLNTIRLPMYYRNFLTTEYRYTKTDEELCAMDFDSIPLDFSKLDTFLEYAKAHDLKVIIDMHGVMGGQSGFEHCGTRDIDFWDNEDYIEFMCNLWRAIAEHYLYDADSTEDRSDLASTILAFDLVNEPTNRNEIGTGPKQWAVMDRMYDAIREVDQHHVISIEGVWFPVSLPSPEKYDWDNVLYQFHYYNWDWQGTPNWLYYSFICGFSSFVNFDVPKLIGEFNFFGDPTVWEEYLPLYDKMGWGWTIWSYKVISVGWWDNSWGILVQNLDLTNKDGQLNDNDPTNDNLKLDLRTASYEEILEAWSNQYSAVCGQEGVYTTRDGKGTTYSVLVKYFEKLAESKGK